MIQVIFGEKGAGKTKRILDLANEKLKTAKGSIVFVDADKQYMFDVKHSIRFIDASEFQIDSPKMFYGFLCGLAAQDFDLECIYIDSFLKLIDSDEHPLQSLDGLFSQLDKFSAKCGLSIVISINGDPEKIPDFFKPYML